MYGRGGNLTKAVEMFNLARTNGVALDEKAYTNLISYYGKAGRMIFLNFLMLTNTNLSNYIFNHFVGKTHEASLLFSQMQEEGIKPGQVCR